MMHSKDKYEVNPQSRATLSDRLSSYYGNFRSILLGRRSTYDVDETFPTADDSHPSTFKEKETIAEEISLRPKCLDLQRTMNREAHRTSSYEIPNLILRRGQTFDMSIAFDRVFSEQDDTFTLQFVTGRKPMQSKGTVISVHKAREVNPGSWGYQITEIDEKKVSIKVCTSASAIVGKYQLFVDTVHKLKDGASQKCRYCHPDDIFVIFNPWCVGDSVYLEEETHREEFVLNETGRIWMGTVGKFCVRPWNFAQFDDVCLMAALSMMEKSELGDPARGNPLLVVKALSRVINNNERDGGVLVGNWSGKYDDGISPYAWNGSSSILEEFLKKRKGVKYGQCWTFSAIATTVFRALGIPTRCITNFRSAHDSDYSIQIDNFWTPEGRPRKMMDDTIWDFHVWNESWFRRPDLPEGYDGWQAFDPTPQECYEGVFTCGPCPVRAIRNGDLYLGYDTKFLFAEVNGDRVFWTVDSEGNMTPVFKDIDVVGKFMSTKAVNTISRDDVTSKYKHETVSIEKADVITKANGFCGRTDVTIQKPSASDVVFSLSGDVQKSGDMEIELKMANNSEEPRIVEVYMIAVATKYTAVPLIELKESNSTNVLEPRKDSVSSLSLKGTEYLSTLDADSHISLYVMATVKETSQVYLKREIYRVEQPNLELKTEGSAVVGKPFDVIVKLVNPLSVPLTGGSLCMEGPGMVKPSSVKIKKSIGPNEEFRETIQVKPRRAGRREIIASFQCKQLCNVTGVVEVDVVNESKN